MDLEPYLVTSVPSSPGFSSPAQAEERSTSLADVSTEAEYIGGTID